MKTSPIIILAMTGFLLLFYITLKGAGPVIENKISSNANAILQSNGLNDVQLNIDGRDLVFTGKVNTSSQMRLLDSLGKDIPGVRIVKNQVLVIPEQPVQKKLPHVSLFYQPNAFTVTIMHKVLLKQIVDFFQTNPQFTIHVNGYTDTEGEENFNLHLSEKRAKFVYDYLVEKGIPVTQIAMNYFGELNPNNGNITLQEQDQNRKVEVVISEVN